ncbi:DegT/DnrJ/EryC1/StrS family aminotransferase [Hominibacterium faecale]|uniref:DegT/DnrJ/EryC1/StrS family aminotransferase n=1 Tax=Hominibacterium faecale TaxID=2839743 RepID=UPI0022B29BBC|nr:DegT/DnrJ/EryC1/StrS family aminotransferase [Hominibacterium faecale]
MQFIDLHKQYDRIKEDVQKSMEQVYRHKRFIMGEEVCELESRLQEYTKVKHVITCASGTDALTIPLMAKNLTRKNAVFVPSFTFFASAESITLAGGTPVFVDSEWDTFNMDPVDLEKKILSTQQTTDLEPSGVIAVDLFGLPADHKEICKVADKYNLFVLEDAAQGFGGNIEGKKAASFGNIAATSFFPAKPLGCYGDGGAIFTDDDQLADLIRSIHIHGQGVDKYDNVRIGLNSRLDTMQAVILLAKLKIFDEELERRNEVADLYSQQLEDLLEIPIVPNGYHSSWAQYTVKAENQDQRDTIVKALKSQDIPVMIYYSVPAHKSTAYSKKIKVENDNLRICERLSSTVFSLPMHPYLEKHEITKICDAVKKSIKA